MRSIELCVEMPDAVLEHGPRGLEPGSSMHPCSLQSAGLQVTQAQRCTPLEIGQQLAAVRTIESAREDSLFKDLWSASLIGEVRFSRAPTYQCYPGIHAAQRVRYDDNSLLPALWPSSFCTATSDVRMVLSCVQLHFVVLLYVCM